tara:strand:+ start:491 stop:1384 length:894 start_codon:yes stop_codon:yes gene_type:complete
MILVTGASGFIGSKLIDKLISDFGKSKIIALSSKPLNNCKFIICKNHIINSNLFEEKTFNKIEIIIHAGAFTPKEVKQSNDWDKYSINIISTEALMKVKFPNLKKFIFLSTLDVYDDVGVITEKTNLSPKTLYGQSKVFCEKMLESWSTQNKIICQILRLGHVYGPGEKAYAKVIPVIIKKILNKETIKIFGSGSDIRSYIFINDAILAIINSIQLNKYTGPINITSSNQISIKELVEKLINISNADVNIEFDNNIDLIKRDFIFDNAKMKKLVLFSETSLDIGLEEEIKYFKNLKE